MEVTLKLILCVKKQLWDVTVAWRAFLLLLLFCFWWNSVFRVLSERHVALWVVISFSWDSFSHTRSGREREGRGATAFSTIIITQFDPIMWTFSADGLVERLFLKMLLWPCSVSACTWSYSQQLWSVFEQITFSKQHRSKKEGSFLVKQRIFFLPHNLLWIFNHHLYSCCALLLILCCT